MGKRRIYTISYSCVQASFWMSLCVFMGFAAVYLQSIGYSNAQLGAIMACGTLGGSLLGPMLSSLIDRNVDDSITAQRVMPIVIAAEAVALIALLLFPAKGIITSAAFVMFTVLSTSVNSLSLKLYTDAVYCGLDLDYGVARSMGSLGYVLTSFAVGVLCESISARAVPAAGLLICAFQMFACLDFSGHLEAAKAYMNENAGKRSQLGAQKNTSAEAEPVGRSSTSAEAEPGADALKKEERGATIATFLICNKKFCMLLAGSILIFYAHNTLCNFFINVVRNVGGDESVMGFLNGLMALIEIPVIFFYTKLTRRWETSSVLKTAFLIFTLKAAAIAAAGSVGGIAGALLLQAPSFGLYTGAIVPYVDAVISHEDSAKAQSLAFSVTMLGSVFASTISGRLFDVMSVSRVMWIAFAVSAVGSLLAYAGVQRTQK